MAMTLRLDPALSQELRLEAQRTGRTQASLVTEAVSRFLRDDQPRHDKHPLPPPSSYQQISVDLLPKPVLPSLEVLDEQRAERF